MEEQTKQQLKEFFTICFSRLELGEEMHGERFKSIDLIEEIINELADISNYAFLQYLKLIKLKNKIKNIEA